jgi:hypothetical protein
MENPKRKKELDKSGVLREHVISRREGSRNEDSRRRRGYG